MKFRLGPPVRGQRSDPAYAGTEVREGFVGRNACPTCSVAGYSDWVDRGQRSKVISQRSKVS